MTDYNPINYEIAKAREKINNNPSLEVLTLVIYSIPGGHYGDKNFVARGKKVSTLLRMLGMEYREATRVSRLPPDEIGEIAREVYIEKTRQYHPDLHPDKMEYEPIFKKITFAYTTLRRILANRSRYSGSSDAMTYATTGWGI